MSDTKGWRKVEHFMSDGIRKCWMIKQGSEIVADLMSEPRADLILAALKDQASESKALALLAGEIADLRNSERNLKTQLLNALNSQEQHAWPFPEPESKWTKEQWRQLAILARTSKERLEAALAGANEMATLARQVRQAIRTYNESIVIGLHPSLRELIPDEWPTRYDAAALKAAESTEVQS